MSWIPVSEPPAESGPVELQLADGTVVDGSYCGGGWVVHFGYRPVVWSLPAYWRAKGKAN